MDSNISQKHAKSLDVLLTMHHGTLMNQHQIDTLFNTHPTHVITPNSICADPPEDGRVTPEICRDIDS
jgi:hypothetical protein